MPEIYDQNRAPWQLLQLFAVCSFAPSTVHRTAYTSFDYFFYSSRTVCTRKNPPHNLPFLRSPFIFSLLLVFKLVRCRNKSMAKVLEREGELAGAATVSVAT